MKNIKTVILFTSISLLVVACKKEQLLGAITTKTETFNDIHTVNINIPGTVSIQPDTAFSVYVQAHEEIVNAISITNTLGQLTVSIAQPEGGLKFDIFTVVIKTKMLRELNNNSSGDVSVGDVMNYTSSKISQNSTGSITISDLNSDLTEVNLTGSGNLTVAGVTENANIRLTGAGNVKSYGLVGKNVIANISGNGNIETTATATLGAIISGSGTIFYKGNPSLDVSITGTGSIKDEN